MPLIVKPKWGGFAGKPRDMKLVKLVKQVRERLDAMEESIGEGVRASGVDLRRPHDVGEPNPERRG